MTSQRPNILFFFTDDQRFDTIHALGNAQIHTPSIDRLVAQGTTFTHAFIPGGTSQAVCMPSRAMLWTGRTLFHLQGAGEGIPSDHIMLGELLREHGYQTFGTGKWHNGPSAYARNFTAGGEIFFGGMEDHWNVPACDFDPTGRYDSTLPLCVDPWRSKEMRIRPGDHVTAGKHSSELFADAAIQWLENYDCDDPFLVYISLMAPHDPRVMPERFRAMYTPDAVPFPPNFMGGHPFDNGDLRVRDELLAGFPRDPDEIRGHIADYYAMITHLDAQLGRVWEALERTGHARNTIVVLAGDNGLALGQHGLMGKQSLYEHSLRVPLIFAGPGIPQGVRRDDLVYLLDIYPTLCELIGLAPPPSVEGQSLVPAMRGNREKARDALYLAYLGVQRAVRTERHKLIEYHVRGRRTTQLFDVQADPWELTNLADDPASAETVKRLRHELVRLRDQWDDGATVWGQQFWGG